MKKSCKKVAKNEQKVKKKSHSKFLYFCNQCDYTTSRKSSWNKHIKTKKHCRKVAQNVRKVAKKVAHKKFSCEFCGKNIHIGLHYALIRRHVM